MTSIPRLIRTFPQDHVTARERLLFTERRRGKPLVLPLILAALVLYFYVLPAFGAQRQIAPKPEWGVTKGGYGFVVMRDDKGPVYEFLILYSTERL